MKRHTVNLSLAMLVLGFLLSFSYQFARENKDHDETAENWKEEYSLRDRLISQEKQNKKLEQELYKKQQEVQKTETALKKEKKSITILWKMLKGTECSSGKSAFRAKELR